MSDLEPNAKPATTAQMSATVVQSTTSFAEVLNPIAIDEDGDLEIAVGSGDDTQSFIVCAKTLARHSPVFKRMLFGGFKESKPTRNETVDWVVELPDDNPKPFKILLDIIHGWFEQVPELPTLNELTALLVLTDKYDVTSLTRPWAVRWMKGVQFETQHLNLLPVAWELGKEDVFDAMVTKIANESARSPDGSERLQYGGLYLDEVTALEPPGLFEAIRQHRAAGVAAELSPYMELYTKLTTATGSDFWCTRSAELADRHICDSMLLGSLVMGLLRKGIPITAAQPAEQYLGSLSFLRATLRDLQLFVNHEVEISPVVLTCREKLVDWMEQRSGPAKRLKDEAVLVQHSHKIRLLQQAQKTGIDRLPASANTSASRLHTSI
ncbi:hypothetical protein CORC01_02211 [Colletotrichum orchidophilum]|uniref:BTB domain-containing protein n=1 Tax=Colletotrichum orchidophilum TaxID=1209926 RepID=A0A1G4BMJ0_9PEZI|nr:uncharacterized protein CORC01_02211 [Colletotrichum orchidophilum]OHF02516.1 hypothetical protein CORC01_02211 [Colletotrichum orchidophilum]